MIRLLIDVDNISLVLASYDKIKIYRADAEAGPYNEVSTTATRLALLPESEQYYYYDSTGTVSKWYKTTYFNSTTSEESTMSSALQGGTEYQKVGYSFKNYSPPATDWGQVLTADDIRFTYLWGIDLTSADVSASDVKDAQLEYCIDSAVEAFEKDFNINIKKRIYKVEPASTLIRSPEWRSGVDYTHEEDWYDFDVTKWRTGFIQLRHYPVQSIETLALYDIFGNFLIDLKPYLRLYKESGQVQIYPKSGIAMGISFANGQAFGSWTNILNRNYPCALKIEYTTGFHNSDFVPRDLRDAIGTFATMIALNWVGDGLLAGFSSSSLSLDGLSESFSSTQSATSAYFGARIVQYQKALDAFRKTNKYKYCNVPMGFIGA